MKDLIARLESATGPDYVLDSEIALAFGWKRDVVRWEEGEDVCWYAPDGKSEGGNCPFFTLRVDDAMRLIEPGSAWAVSHSPDEHPFSYPRPYRATVMPDLSHKNRRDATVHHEYPAVALCIAALKARAASPKQPGAK